MRLAVPENEIAPLLVDTARALLQTRSLMKDRFSDTDKNWGAGEGTGVYASLQGLRTILGIVSALVEDDSVDIWAVVGPHFSSLCDEWQQTCEKINESGYSAEPYDERNVLRDILNGGGAKKNRSEAYVDSVSWTLSTSILFTYVAKLLEHKAPGAVSPQLLATTEQQLVAALKTLVDAQCPGGGWSWASGATKGTLYFSWCAVEGLADFYDYIAGESADQIGIAADDKMLAIIAARSPELLTKVEDARELVTQFLSSNYLEKALSTGLEIRDFADDKKVEFIGPGQSIVPIYFELYLLESLILLNYDAPGKAVSTANRERLVKLYGRVLQQFVQLRQIPKDQPFWTSGDYGTLKFNILSEAYRGKQDGFTVQDPGLWPQFVRTMVLYRFYTSPSSDVDADIVGADKSALHYLLDDRIPTGPKKGDGLWDTFAHNLGLTSRAIEGLIDVYDYYNRLATKHAAPGAVRPPADLSEQLAEAVYPHIAARLRVEFGTNGLETGKPAEIDGLRGQVRGHVRDFVTLQLAEVALPLTPWGGLNRTQVLEEVFQREGFAELRNNPDTLELAELLVWLNFCSGVRLFDLILKEALLARVSPKEADKFRKEDADKSKDRQELIERINLGLKAVAQNEVDVSAERPESLPNYKELIERALTQVPNRPKGKQ